MSKPTNISLHIDHLVLDGAEFAHLDGAVLQAAVSAELTQMLANGGLPAGWQSAGLMGAVQAGNFNLPHQPNSQGLGQQIAQQIYGGER